MAKLLWIFTKSKNLLNSDDMTCVNLLYKLIYWLEFLRNYKYYDFEGKSSTNHVFLQIPSNQLCNNKNEQDDSFC